MPKRVHRKRMTKRMGKRGGFGEGLNAGLNATGDAAMTGVRNFGEDAKQVLAGAFSETKDAVARASEAAQSALSSAGEKAKQGEQNTESWFGSLFAPKECCPCPSNTAAAAAGGGSRRRKRRGRKSKNMFSGLMKMVGFNSKKRGKKGGIGGPSQGYQHIVGANFPSAAAPDGNNIYDLAKFNPSKPFYGGMKGGCMHHNFMPLSPAPYPSNDMLGGKTKRHHKKRKHGGKSKRRHW